jgi:phage shock protein E
MKRALVIAALCAVVLGAAVLAGCGGSGVCATCNPPSNARQDITAAQLQAMMGDGQPLLILDVRTAQEYAAGHIPGAVNAPLDQLDVWAGTLDGSLRTVCVCASGGRSQQAADQLVGRGFTDVYNLLGGTYGWPGPLEQ